MDYSVPRPVDGMRPDLDEQGSWSAEGDTCGRMPTDGPFFVLKAFNVQPVPDSCVPKGLGHGYSTIPHNRLPDSRK